MGKLAAFLSIVILLSLLAGCSGSSDSVSSPANTSTAVANGADPAKGEAPKTNSEFPPIAEKVAQAEMRGLDGSTTKVADRKGKVLLLNMWATWCGPCRGEMPTLVRMQSEHADKNFEIIGLNTDDGDSKEMVEKFAKEMNLNYTLVWAPTDMQAALTRISNFQAIPQSFVVDRDGRLRGVFRGGGKAELKLMEELVAKVVAE